VLVAVIAFIVKTNWKTEPLGRGPTLQESMGDLQRGPSIKTEGTGSLNTLKKSPKSEPITESILNTTFSHYTIRIITVWNCSKNV
jgi:hypothetical protein